MFCLIFFLKLKKKIKKKIKKTLKKTQTTNEFQGDGCYVLESNDSTTKCACLHLTMFAGGWEEFVPPINLITWSSFLDFTPENLLKYPAGWIALVSLFSVFIVLCWFKPYKMDKPFIYNSESVFKLKPCIFFLFCFFMFFYVFFMDTYTYTYVI